MKVELHRHSLEIVVDGTLDEVFAETVLGLREEGDSIRLVRRDVRTSISVPGMSSPLVGFKIETEEDGR